MYTRVYFNYFIGRFPVQTQAGLGTQPCYEVLGDLWVKYRLGQWACPFNNDPKFAVEVNKSQIKKSEGILGTLTVRDWCRNDQLTGTSKIFILFLF